MRVDDEGGQPDGHAQQQQQGGAGVGGVEAATGLARVVPVQEAGGRADEGESHGGRGHEQHGGGEGQALHVETAGDARQEARDQRAAHLQVQQCVGREVAGQHSPVAQALAQGAQEDGDLLKNVHVRVSVELEKEREEQDHLHGARVHETRLADTPHLRPPLRQALLRFVFRTSVRDVSSVGVVLPPAEGGAGGRHHQAPHWRQLQAAAAGDAGVVIQHGHRPKLHRQRQRHQRRVHHPSDAKPSV